MYKRRTLVTHLTSPVEAKPREVVGKLAEVFLHVERVIVYMGFVISRQGLKMDPQKVIVILEWSEPVNATEV